MTKPRVMKQYFPGIGVLLATYAYAMDATRYTGMEDKDVIYELVKNLAKVFHVSVDYIHSRLLDYVIKRWGTDPNQLGGFAGEGANGVSTYFCKTNVGLGPGLGSFSNSESFTD